MLLPRLYAIVDVAVCARAGRAPRDVARAYLSAGVRLIQLRAKGMPGGEFLELASGIAADARTGAATFIVNDRADLAALSAAAGVHLGQDDLSAAEARRILGAGAIIGVSTHSVAQVEDAVAQPISYLAIGPVFGTATKDTGYAARGLESVLRAAALASARALPVVAIGGVTLATAARVIDAGASAVAVISDLLAGDPEARAREYLTVLA